jgi:hypothetical protein
MSILTLEEKANEILSALVVLWVLTNAVGGTYNYFNYQDKIVQQGVIKKVTKMYGPLHRLELIYENNSPKEVSQISLLENGVRFELDKNGQITRITEKSHNLLGESRMKVLHLKEYSSGEMKRLEEEVKNYIKWFEEK